MIIIKIFERIIILLNSSLLALLDGLEIRVLHGVFRGNSLSVVVSQHVVQEVKSFVRDKRLVLVVHKFAPWLLWVLTQDIIVVAI